MPYIRKGRRNILDLDETGLSFPTDPGELNYKVTRLVTQFMQDRELNYQVINDVIGALEGAKLEFYRRVASPYEEEDPGKMEMCTNE